MLTVGSNEHFIKDRGTPDPRPHIETGSKFISIKCIVASPSEVTQVSDT